MSKKSKPNTSSKPIPTTKEFLEKASANQQAGLAQIAAAVAQQQRPVTQNAQPFDFTKVHLHIGIPAYGGLLTEPCFTSFLRFVLLAQKVGLTWSLDTMVNESLITRARNNLMAKMMYNKAATHFMFIDADIRFQAESIFQMIAYDRDIIGGLYPKKAYPISYAINLKRETKVLGEIFTVDTLATGFLIFKRKVYEDLITAHPETKYVDDVGLGKQYEPYMYSIFDCFIDKAGHYLSEDWAFCRRAAELGYDMWAHSKVLLNHIGHHEFHGDLSKLPDLAIPKLVETAEPAQTTSEVEPVAK